MRNYLNIGWIGAGNVSWHLAPAIENAGHRISVVFNRSKENGEALIDRLYNARLATNLDLSGDTLDLIIICVSDQALPAILSELIVPDGCTITHTSGSISLEILEIAACDHYGVIYPMQTFTMGKKVEISKVPIFIEGSDNHAYEKIMDLSKSISKYVYELNSHARMHLHLATVISSNFTNHLIRIAKEILDDNEIDYKILKPVISEGIENAFSIGPENSQTGPAVRADYDTIDKHLNLLNNRVDTAEIYQVITNNILRAYYPDKDQLD